MAFVVNEVFPVPPLATGNVPVVIIAALKLPIAVFETELTRPYASVVILGIKFSAPKVPAVPVLAKDTNLEPSNCYAAPVV